MPLDTTNFHPQGPVKSVDLLQFYNLFTGLMTDQPVAFSNSVTIGGNQGLTTVPLRVYGATGQNTNLIDLYADKSQAQPGFGFSALGRFAWGPGGASPQDTFLSRIATQHGHASDTPGLLVTPYLEVAGNISADGYNFLNGASITAPAGNPNRLVLDQDLFVNRDVQVGRTLTIVNANQTLSQAGTTGISLRSSDGSVFLASSTVVQMQANAYFDGTNWVRYSTSSAAAYIGIGVNTGIGYGTAPAGANPIAWTTQMTLDVAGNMILLGSIAATTFIVQGTNVNTKLGPGSTLFLMPNEYIQDAGGGIIRYMCASGGRHNFECPGGPGGGYGNIYCGNLTAQGGALQAPQGYVAAGTPLSGVPGDISACRGANTGYVWLGNNTHYIGFDGSMYQLPTNDLNLGGNLRSYSTIYMYDGVHYLQAAGPSIYYSCSSGGGHNFYQNGQAAWAALNGSAFTVQSARKSKTNICVLGDALDILLDPDLHGVAYDDIATEEHRVGFVADPWLARVPELVALDDRGEVMGLNYGAVGAITFEALKQYVQQTNARIAELERRLAA